MSIAAVPQTRIAKALKTDVETLTKYFREELDSASDMLNAQVVGSLFKNAMKGNVTAQIFWLKTRLRWKESDRLELTDGDGKPVRFTVNLGRKRVPRD